MLLGVIRRDGRWRELLVNQLDPKPGDRVLQVGGDGLVGLDVRRREPASDVVDLEPHGGRRGRRDPLASAPGDTNHDGELSDELIKKHRPFNKAVCIFPTSSQPTWAKRLFAIIRHGLPSHGELHVVEFGTSTRGDLTVESLLRGAGFKAVQRQTIVTSLLGPIELFIALKQPPPSEPA